MATVKDIFNFIDSIAPFDSQEEWDNSGFLVGDENREVKKILFALDVTTDIIDQAVECNAELIITHHPVIFKPVSTVLSNGLIYKLVNSEISIICAHTNYDKAYRGVNDILCNTIGLNTYFKVDNTCLNIGNFERAISTEAFVKRIKDTLGSVVRYNNIEKDIKNIAVCSGSGSDYLDTAEALGCDALLTGDASHHAFLDANEMGIVLVAAGHFETEILAIEPLMNKIEDNFSIECKLAVQKTPIVTF